MRRPELRWRRSPWRFVRLLQRVEKRVRGLQVVPRELRLLTATVWLPSEYPRELKLPDAAHTCPVK